MQELLQKRKMLCFLIILWFTFRNTISFIPLIYSRIDSLYYQVRKMYIFKGFINYVSKWKIG